VADVEALVGISGYLTTTPGLGGVIKRAPEDFVVDEVSSPPPKVSGGRYTVARIRSTNWETNRLIREMSRRLAVSRKRISFAGTKDKRAVTTQLFSFELPEERVRELHLADVELLEAYPSDRRLEIGDLLGNRFQITIRDLAVGPEDARAILAATAAQLEVLGGFPNFFGLQRFGSIRPITHVVGQHIVHGEFKEAVDAYVANPIEGEDEEVYEARQDLAASGDYGEALKAMPDVMGFEKALLNYLVRKPGDYVGALQELPFNLQMMFIHGYQSYMFNRVLSERMRLGLPLHEPIDGDLVLPIGRQGLPDRDRPLAVEPGNLAKVRRRVREGKAVVSGPLFGSESIAARGAMGEIEEAVVFVDGLKPEDFVIPRIPRLSSRGTRRELVAAVRGLRWEVEGDAVHLAFELAKGCYATSLLREVMKRTA
jgi:tRNA pseudouridine13 synthase